MVGTQGSYNIHTESMEPAKFSMEHRSDKETQAILDAHEMDLIPGEDEDQIGEKTTIIGRASGRTQVDRPKSRLKA
jgi:hypothetical protein